MKEITREEIMKWWNEFPDFKKQDLVSIYFPNRHRLNIMNSEIIEIYKAQFTTPAAPFVVGEDVYRWVKASERMPEKPPKERELHGIHVNYRGSPEILVWANNQWCWDDAEPDKYPIHPDSWSAIEWLEQVPASTSESGVEWGRWGIIGKFW